MFGNCGLLPLSPYLLCSAADYVLLVTAGHGRHGGCLCGPDLRCEVCTSNLTRGLNTSRHTTPALTVVRLHYASLCTQFVYIYVGVTAPWKVDLQDVLNNFTFSFNLTLLCRVYFLFSMCSIYGFVSWMPPSVSRYFKPPQTVTSWNLAPAAPRSAARLLLRWDWTWQWRMWRGPDLVITWL